MFQYNDGPPKPAFGQTTSGSDRGPPTADALPCGTATGFGKPASAAGVSRGFGGGGFGGGGFSGGGFGGGTSTADGAGEFFGSARNQTASFPSLFGSTPTINQTGFGGFGPPTADALTLGTATGFGKPASAAGVSRGFGGGGFGGGGFGGGGFGAGASTANGAGGLFGSARNQTASVPSLFGSTPTINQTGFGGFGPPMADALPFGRATASAAGVSGAFGGGTSTTGGARGVFSSAPNQTASFSGFYRSPATANQTGFINMANSTIQPPKPPFRYEWLVENYYGQRKNIICRQIENNNSDLNIMLKIAKSQSPKDNDTCWLMFSRKLYVSGSFTINNLAYNYDTKLFLSNEWCDMQCHSSNYGTFTVTFSFIIDESVTEYTTKDNTCMDCVSHATTNPGCMMDDLTRLLKSMILSDVKLLAGDGKKVKAHKNILASRSPVFEAMFTRDLRESKSNEVDMKQFDVDVVDEFLSYAYTNKCPNIATLDFELLRLADMYQVNALKYLCSVSLTGKVSKENCMSLLVLAEKYECEFLKEFIKSFIAQNGGIDLLADQAEWKVFIAGTLRNNLKPEKEE